MSTPYMPQGQHPAVWVTEGLPGPLLAALVRRGGIPHDVRTLVLDQLGRRSAGDLRLRAERRWFQRYSNLTGPEIADRADRLAYELLAPSGCEVALCEDGWLLDDSGSCRCRPSRSVVDTTGSEGTGRPRSSPEFVTEVVAALRAERRRVHGMPRGARSGHVVKQPRPYQPAPPVLREPEPERDNPAAGQAERVQREERDREAQHLAEQRTKADRAARANHEGENQ
ncbi:hypothetical protein [Kitasatospora sp. NPDC057223]|uniref:hypothetical protein n=1 Tax=Kitasatospora sp. NPDC057223 TaxID=3346055 RepID=UPI00362E74DF